MNFAGLLFLLPLFFAISIQSSSTPTPSSLLSSPRFIKSIRKSSINLTTEGEPQRYFEVTRPLPTDGITPACSVSVLNYSFGNTYGSPPVSVGYTPPPVTCKWSRAVLEFRAECKGEQYDRIAGVWLAGVELLRTSTAQPTEDGIFWNVRKDVSRYSSILTRSNLTLAVMLENIVNDEFTGVYHVSISLLFYSDKAVRFPLSVVSEEPEAHKLSRKLISVGNLEIGNKLELDRVMKSLYPYDTPADLIIPISRTADEGFWFRIQDERDVQSKNFEISPKTYKAVLELYVSFHGDDEFWYMNPPDSYLEANHLTTGRGNGAYREVLVTIDGKIVGTVIPFPVIFTGGINPLFWEPVVSIGAFDLPSYDIHLTPFLGLLSDNKTHSIGFQVADGISFWLLDANLHLWLDHSNVYVKDMHYHAPSVDIEREYEFNGLDGGFEIELERGIKGVGRVTSSKGKLITEWRDRTKFKSRLKFDDNGTMKVLHQKIKKKTKIKMSNDDGALLQRFDLEAIYPLKITIETLPGPDEDTYTMITEVVQERSESLSGHKYSTVLNQSQNCTGSMLVKGHSVLSGSAENHQSYDYGDPSGCYSRKVDAVNGGVVADDTLLICVD